jgi:hypothetical protein
VRAEPHAQFLLVEPAWASFLIVAQRPASDFSVVDMTDSAHAGPGVTHTGVTAEQVTDV